MFLTGDLSAPNSRAHQRFGVSKRFLRMQFYASLMMIDALCIILSFCLVGRFSHGIWFHPECVKIIAMVLPIYFGVAINANSYSLRALTSPGASGVQAVMHMLFSMLAVLSVLYFADAKTGPSRTYFALGVIASITALSLTRHPFARYVRHTANGALTNDLLICDGVAIDGDKHIQMIDAQEAHLQPDLNDPHMLNRLGRWLHGFDRVIIACPAERQTVWRLLLQGANIQGEIIIPGFDLTGVLGVGHFEGRTTQLVSKGPLSMSNRFKKRVFDVALTAPALVLLFPLMILIAIAIKLETPGPIFFRQDRVGRGNRLFKILKFRSMRTDLTDHSGSVSANRDDKRITKVGAIIRRTSIDELPQLINVLLGDMSLVGPRPHALGSTAGNKLFWEISQLYWCRHSLKPGITGLAQIRGFRGATTQAVDLENRLQADLEYIEHWSFMREILILLGTLRVVVHKNAY